ncbi:kinase [Elusimicrobiota bacterium]
MIISKTPFRMSFFGGGTDYPDWYRKEGGAVLSTTIDKYCYISCRFMQPFFNIKYKIVWSHIEAVNSIAEILHPIVRDGLRYLDFNESLGLELHHQGDLPARAGAGSSSAFTVGFINAMSALRGQSIGKHDLALKAIDFEQNVVKEHVGSQDQTAAAYGGFNKIVFHQNGEIVVKPVDIHDQRRSELDSRLMMFYTGIGRLANEIAKTITPNLYKKRTTLIKMRDMVEEGVSLLESSRDLDSFGSMLNETWMLKRELSPIVSNATIDTIYDTALKSGALGGKLLGAGAAGFMVFYVPPDKKGSVRRALSQYAEIPFSFENNGSAILYDENNPRGAQRVA